MSTLVAGLLAATAQAAPTVTPAVVQAPGTVEARFPFTGLNVDSSVTIEPNALILPGDAYTGRFSTVKILGARIEGAGSLKEEARIAAEDGTCFRGGAFLNDQRTYRLDVPANSTVTVVVKAEVPLGLPGHAAGVTLTHGQLEVPGRATTAEEIIETARIQRTGYVDGVSLKASKRKAGKVTFSGRVIPARRTKVTLVSKPVADPVQGAGGRFLDVVGIKPFTFPNEPFARGLKRVGSAKTARNGTFRVTVKVPVNIGVAARTAGSHAGSSCGVLGTFEPVASTTR